MELLGEVRQQSRSLLEQDPFADPRDGRAVYCRHLGHQLKSLRVENEMAVRNGISAFVAGCQTAEISGLPLPHLLHIFHLCPVPLLHINLLQHLNAPPLLSTTMPIPTPPETYPSYPQIFLVASLPHLAQCTRISEITERCFHLFAKLHFIMLWHITKKYF